MEMFNMKVSNDCISLIKQFEGCRLSAYKCPAGVWTIGYGHTAGVKEGMKISQAQAELYLLDDLQKYADRVSKYNSKYGWKQNEFDALVSFCYNVGSIDQLTANGTRSRQVIAEKMLLYNKGGGKVLPGLVRRRNAERALFTQTVDEELPILRKGNKGNYVGYLQEKLNTLGYNCGKVDKIFGSKTLEAVKAFQVDRNLVVDGVVGPKTWLKLNDKPIENPIKTYSLIKDGNTKISANFSVRECVCKDGTDTILIDTIFVKEYLQKIREHFNAPVTINSGYRTAAYNKKVGGASNSYHVKGQAFDIVVSGRTPAEVAAYAYQIGIPGIILYNTFVHVDSRATKYYARNDNGKVTKVSKF
jgi:GH24 family phage-related lysozyme (muramidase)